MGKSPEPREANSWRRWIFAIFFLLGGALLLLSAHPAAATITQTIVQTWPDGNTTLVVNVSGCGQKVSVGNYTVPFDAQVVYFDVRVTWSPVVATPSGWVGLDIGADGLLVMNLSYYELSVEAGGGDGGFGAYLKAVNATSGNVSVPVVIQGCSTTGGAFTATFRAVTLIYRQGAPDGTHIPEIRGPVPQGVRLELNTSNFTLLDLTPYVLDRDGQPLSFQVGCGFPALQNCHNIGWPNVTVWMNGTYLAASSKGGWLGTVSVIILVWDPDFNEASINAINVTIVPALQPNSAPVAIAPIPDFSIAAGSSVDGIFDLRDFFTDADGEALAFSLKDLRSDSPGGMINASLNGPFLGVSAAANATLNASLCFRARAMDRRLAFEDSNLACARVVAPGGVGATPTITRIAANGNPLADIAADKNFTLTLTTDLPLDNSSNVSWILDGAVVGAGPVVTGLRVAQGPHTLEVVIENPAWTVRRTVAFRALGPKPAGDGPGPPGGPVGLADPGLLLTAIAVVFIGAALAARAEVVRYGLLGGLGASLFARLKRESLLDHFVRGRLYQLIADEPGIHFSELMRRADLGNGATLYHLRTLEKGGYIRSKSAGALTHFFVTGQRFDDKSYALSQTDHAVLEAVSDIPGISQQEITARVGKSKSVVSRSVARLSHLGYVTTEQKGRNVGVFPRRALPAESVERPPTLAGQPEENL